MKHILSFHHFPSSIGDETYIDSTDAMDLTLNVDTMLSENATSYLPATLICSYFTTCKYAEAFSENTTYIAAVLYIYMT